MTVEEKAEEEMAAEEKEAAQSIVDAQVQPAGRLLKFIFHFLVVPGEFQKFFCPKFPKTKET